jgi:hypothetical protein
MDQLVSQIATSPKSPQFIEIGNRGIQPLEAERLVFSFKNDYFLPKNNEN